MALLSVQNVTLNLGGKPLLQNADLSIEPGERVCLTGRNGAGKSSLLALLGDQLQPDSGTIVRAGTPIGQMPQNVPEHWQGSVFSLVSEALSGSASAFGGNSFAPGGSSSVAGQSGASSPASAFSTATSFMDGGDSITNPDGWEHYGEVMAVLNHLKLPPDADFALLSGGTKRRVALARALVCSDDLILDEPTNHLDLATVLWLEEFLLRKAKTLVFVSHDRAFSERLATRVVEIDRGKLYSYACSYADYPERREERLEIEERESALFDKKLAQEEVWIRQGIKARRTRNMGRVRALREMRSERAARREKQGNVRMAAQEAERSGKLVIEADNVAFTHPDGKHLFSGFSTIIQRGDRIGIVGDNGTGKSTLIRLLLGELQPTEGSVRRGTKLEISYFDQLRESLDPEVSVMHSVAEGNDIITIGQNTRHVAGYLQDFLFPADRLRLPVKALSGGERNRLLLAKLFARPSNLLVMDEPTNDLDVETLELLEELLAEYSGTVLVVSHDRKFLDNLATGILALEGDGQVREYVGAYTDWLRQRPAAEEKKTPDKPKRSSSAVAEANKPRKRTFNEQKEFDQLTQELEALPARIDALEQEQAALEATLADPDLFAGDPDAFTVAANRLSTLEEEQTELLLRWEFIEGRLAELGELRG